MVEFPDEIHQALVQLSDALCTHERSTTVGSVLILRMSDGAEYRAMDGKPGVPDEVGDRELFLAGRCCFGIGVGEG